MFTHRSPFDQLSNTQIEEFARVFGILGDPTTVASLLRICDRRKNLGEIFDAEFLRKMEFVFRSIPGKEHL